jgi:polyribonucleotide nucleotidyltransferase
VDGENDLDMLSVNAASMALHISDIPFEGPIAAVRVGKVDGEFVVNPTHEQREKSALDLIVSGTAEHIIMVEAGAQLVSEQEIVDAIKFAQGHLKTLCEAQENFRKELGAEKSAPAIIEVNSEVMAFVKEALTEDKIEAAVCINHVFRCNCQVTVNFQHTVRARSVFIRAVRE